MFRQLCLAVQENLRVLPDNGVTCKHLEVDQWPENQVCFHNALDLLRLAGSVACKLRLDDKGKDLETTVSAVQEKKYFNQ